MNNKLLSVMNPSCNYLPIYEVDKACSYQQAKQMIEEAEARFEPYDSLDLPVDNKKEFWDFLEWMRHRRYRYPFSVFGNISTRQFVKIRDKCRAMGFVFLT